MKNPASRTNTVSTGESISAETSALIIRTNRKMEKVINARGYISLDIAAARTNSPSFHSGENKYKQTPRRAACRRQLSRINEDKPNAILINPFHVRASQQIAFDVSKRMTLRGI